MNFVSRGYVGKEKLWWAFQRGNLTSTGEFSMLWVFATGQDHTLWRPQRESLCSWKQQGRLQVYTAVLPMGSTGASAASLPKESRPRVFGDSRDACTAPGPCPLDWYVKQQLFMPQPWEESRDDINALFVSLADRGVPPTPLHMLPDATREMQGWRCWVSAISLFFSLKWTGKIGCTFAVHRVFFGFLFVRNTNNEALNCKLKKLKYIFKVYLHGDLKIMLQRFPDIAVVFIYSMKQKCFLKIVRNIITYMYLKRMKRTWAFG